MNYELNDVDDDSGRDIQNALMERNRRRIDVTKISLTYDMNEPETMSKILNLIEPEFFEVDFHDLKKNGRCTKQFYAGPKSFEYLCIDRLWIKGFKVNLIER